MLSQTDGLGSVYGCNQSVLLLQSITETDRNGGPGRRRWRRAPACRRCAPPRRRPRSRPGNPRGRRPRPCAAACRRWAACPIRAGSAAVLRNGRAPSRHWHPSRGNPRQEQDHQQAQQRVPGPPLRHFADPVFLEAGKCLDNLRQHDPVPTQWRRQPEGGSRAYRRKPPQMARNTSSGMNMPFPKLLRARPAIFGGRPARAPSLEEVLQADADFSFDPAYGLLKLTGEQRIRRFNTDWILEALIMKVHGSTLRLTGQCLANRTSRGPSSPEFTLPPMRAASRGHTPGG